MAKISFSGKHVVVTGGGSGIGRALAHEFAHEGAARVSITDIDQDRIDRVLSELRGKGVEAAGYRVDHGSEEETRLWAEKLLGEGVPVDVLCANAGVAAAGMLGSMQMDNWRWVMDVNVMGVALSEAMSGEVGIQDALDDAASKTRDVMNRSGYYTWARYKGQ